MGYLSHNEARFEEVLNGKQQGPRETAQPVNGFTAQN